MKTKNIFLFALIALISVTSFGCFGVSDEFRSIKENLLRDTKAGYKKDIEFSVGKITLSMARMFVKLSDEDKEAEEILGNISSAEIGVYKVKNDAAKKNYMQVINTMEKQGWTYIVRSFEKNKSSVIFVKGNKSGWITELFVVAFEDSELNMVKVRGNLNKIIEIAIRDKDAKIGFAHK